MTTSKAKSTAVLALLALTQLITAVDFDIVFVALPDIGRELGFSEQSLQTVVSAYTVVFGGFLLLGGRASDRLGARRTFVVGLLIFGSSSLAAGLAGEPEYLISARAVQGLGAALLTPSTLKLVTTRFDEGPERTRALSIWGAAGATGAAIGALGGGILTSALGWEWVFFVNVPLAAIAVLTAPVLLTPDTSHVDGRRGFDVPGALLATAGSTLVVFGLVNGPDSGWISPRGGGPLVLGLITLGAFALAERRSDDPLIPAHLFRNRKVIAAVSIVFVFMGTVGTQYYLLTTYLQNILGYSPLQAGISFLPLSIFSIIGSARAVPVSIRRWGIRTTLVIGLLGVSISMIALAVAFSVTGSYLAVVPSIVLWGFFAGLSFPSLFISASTGTAADEQGVTAAVVSTSQYLGSAVGLACLVAVANYATISDNGSTATELIVEGLARAGWIAAVVTVLGAVLAAIILPRQQSIPETVVDPDGNVDNTERTGR